MNRIVDRWCCSLARMQMRVSRAFLMLVVICSACAVSIAQKTGGAFPAVTRSSVAKLYVSSSDAPVARIAAEALSRDIYDVTGKQPEVMQDKGALSGNAILIGTIGRSDAIDQLRESHKLDTRAIEGKWECFVISEVKNPLPGVPRALVVAGSDRRGTAYGALELSRAIGVTPWHWWADVPVQRRQILSIPLTKFTSAPPSVQYRGIFINDEDWGFRRWAAQVTDASAGNVGPNAYRRVFELLLRLRVNTLWPAMHEGTLPFNHFAENAKLADEYAIVMGSSHAEPMLRNNVSEWNTQLGQFNYRTNRETIYRYWEDRLKQNGRFENVYTLGMRGIHDSGMLGGGTVKEKAELLEKVIADQRAILANNVSNPVEQVPQVFWVYKEVLDLYRAGLSLPPDVTLGWTDDNFGYIRQMSSPEEQKRPGGGGVYYHISYWGEPHDYLWLCTTPPALIQEEMSKAYRFNARKIWILNVGDIKPGEIGLDYFMRLAWDHAGTAAKTQRGFLQEWAAEQFPKAAAKEIAEVLDQYYRLSFSRKPEFMGFNRNRTGVAHTEYNPVAYGDQNAARQKQFSDLVERAKRLEALLPANYRDAYYELVLYPVRAAALMNAKFLLADKASLFAGQKRASADGAGKLAKKAFNDIQQETERYNALVGGKWKGMMSSQPRNLAVFKMPSLPQEPSNTGVPSRLGVALEGHLEALGEATPSSVPAAWAVSGLKQGELPAFDAKAQTRFIDLFATGNAAVAWTARTSAPWIRLSQASGSVTPGSDTRLSVSISPSAASADSGSIFLQAPGQEFTVRVTVRATAKALNSVRDGVISIAADTATLSGEQHAWKKWDGLGISGAAVEARMPVGSEKASPSAPHLEFRFSSPRMEAPKLLIQTLPTFPTSPKHTKLFAISIDDQAPVTADAAAISRELAVLSNSGCNEIALPALGEGQHRLRVWALDPDLIFEYFTIRDATAAGGYPIARVCR